MLVREAEPTGGLRKRSCSLCVRVICKGLWEKNPAMCVNCERLKAGGEECEHECVRVREILLNRHMRQPKMMGT